MCSGRKGIGIGIGIWGLGAGGSELVAGDIVSYEVDDVLDEIETQAISAGRRGILERLGAFEEFPHYEILLFAHQAVIVLSGEEFAPGLERCHVAVEPGQVFAQTVGSCEGESVRRHFQVVLFQLVEFC